MTIFEEANDIVNNRSEEKNRQYGPFDKGMERAAMIASGMTGKDITALDMYRCMMALKFSRDSFHLKYDNIMDMMAYAGAQYNHFKKQYDATR